MYIPVCHVQYQGHDNVLQLSYVRLDLFYSFVLYHIVLFFFYSERNKVGTHFIFETRNFVLPYYSLFLFNMCVSSSFFFFSTDNVCKYEVFTIKVIQRIIVSNVCVFQHFPLLFFEDVNTSVKHLYKLLHVYIYI